MKDIIRGGMYNPSSFNQRTGANYDFIIVRHMPPLGLIYACELGRHNSSARVWTGIHFDDLQNQIGYDATFTEKYQQLKESLKVYKLDLTVVKRAIELSIEHDEPSEHFESLQSKLEAKVKATETKLVTIKSQSWLNEVQS